MTTTPLFFSRGAGGGEALSVAKGIAAIGMEKWGLLLCVVRWGQVQCMEKQGWDLFVVKQVLEWPGQKGREEQ